MGATALEFTDLVLAPCADKRIGKKHIFRKFHILFNILDIQSAAEEEFPYLLMNQKRIQV
jgi:hypothetical protein